MILKHKVFRNAGGRLRLCLIIPLGNGAKFQYPVQSESEAWSIYEQYLQLNTPEQKLAYEPPLPSNASRQKSAQLLRT